MEEKLADCPKILSRLEEKRVGEAVPAAEPRVSIIIPAYNISQLVSDTLESVFAQTYSDFEAIVINDGSEDTAELENQLEPYFDQIIYGKQQNSGASEARNLAICLSRGSLIAFLDGDDIWMPDFLESQIEFIENSDFDMVYCDARFFGEDYSGDETYMQTTPSQGEVTPVSLINAKCNVITSGTVVKREILERHGLFDPVSKRGQDFDLWFRLAKHGAKIGYQRDVLLKYRVSSTSLSGSNVQRAKRTIGILELIRAKYELNSREVEAWNDQLESSEAYFELESAKHNLIEGNYAEARQRISQANRYYKKPKLFVLQLSLRVSPVLVLKLYKWLRPREVLFIASGKD